MNLAIRGIEGDLGQRDRLSDDFNVQIQAAILGHGITLARGLLVADELRAGRLVCPFKIPVRPPVQYYFVYPPSRRDDVVLATMLTWLRTTAAKTVHGMEAYWGSSAMPQTLNQSGS